MGPTRGTIVCGLDHSEDCRSALRVAAALAARLDSALVLVNVRPSPAELPVGMAPEAKHMRERSLEGGRRLLAELGDELLGEPATQRLTECVLARIEFGDAVERLVAVADEAEASLIVVGARGRRRAAAAVLGSVSQRLAAENSRPVLVVPPGAGLHEALTATEPGTPASIICGVDGSVAGLNAVGVAAGLAAALGFRLVLVHVEDDGVEIPAGQIEFEDRLDLRTRSRLRLLHRAAGFAAGVDVEACLAAGDTAEALDAVCERESAALLAVGTRGFGAFRALTLGSVSRDLAASGTRPVLVVNEGYRPDSAKGNSIHKLVTS